MSKQIQVNGQPYEFFCMQKPPGPNYKLRGLIGEKEHCPTKKKQPAYSIGESYKWSCDNLPGPCYSFKSELTNLGLQLPKTAIINGRPKNKEPEILPGPGQYEPKLPRNIRPITLGSRSKSTPNLNPPPNAYNINLGIGNKSTIQQAPPNALVRSRTELGGIYYPFTKAAVPGPGSYTTLEDGSNKNGNISIKGRHRVKDYNTSLSNPPPGAYNLPTFLDRNKKGFSMGIRHSPCLMPTQFSKNM